MTQLTWNEYLDEVIKEVDRTNFPILFTVSMIKNKASFEHRDKLFNIYINNDCTILGKQSRIDFLNSLKDKE